MHILFLVLGILIILISLLSPIKKLPNCITVGTMRPFDVAMKNLSSSIFETVPAGCGTQNASEAISAFIIFIILPRKVVLASKNGFNALMKRSISSAERL